MFKPKKAEREKIIKVLENLAEKVRLQTRGARGISTSVSPAPGSIDAFVIEYSKSRIVRRVTVDGATLSRLPIRPSDPVLLRGLRTALLVVISRARQRESQAEPESRA